MSVHLGSYVYRKFRFVLRDHEARLKWKHQGLLSWARETSGSPFQTFDFFFVKLRWKIVLAAMLRHDYQQKVKYTQINDLLLLVTPSHLYFLCEEWCNVLHWDNIISQEKNFLCNKSNFHFSSSSRPTQNNIHWVVKQLEALTAKTISLMNNAK